MNNNFKVLIRYELTAELAVQGLDPLRFGFFTIFWYRKYSRPMQMQLAVHRDGSDVL